MGNLDFDQIIDEINDALSRAEKVRDQSYILHREIIKKSGLSIKAIHRNHKDQARKLLDEIHQLVKDSNENICEVEQLSRVGFVHDAQKEYAEAAVTYAIIFDEDMPHPNDLNVRYAAYLNGMAEAVGELRRKLLDLMRQDKGDEGEPLLQAMDEIYSILVTIDFSDAITGGLRRSTDQARAILERTRGDFTNHLISKRLREDLNKQVAKIQEI
ncbi:MAG: haloacid dehalogenase [Vulcanimicrobiota bacterium]